jgi:putative SOS response-associated peptidase YedK
MMRPMCGRYSLHANPGVIALAFKLGVAIDWSARYNITPSSRIVIVREDAAAGRVAALIQWGLIPGWAKDPAIGNKLANARGETVDEKPSFRNAFKRSRCLIPASGFYEWKTVAGRKQPYYMHPVGAPLFAIAGITERWQGPEGVVETCAIITTGPNGVMRNIHDRMPVILSAEDHDAWLDPSNQSVAALKQLIKPCAESTMTAHAVSTRVNAPKNDDAALIEPLDLGELDWG